MKKLALILPILLIFFSNAQCQDSIADHILNQKIEFIRLHLKKSSSMHTISILSFAGSAATLSVGALSPEISGENQETLFVVSGILGLVGLVTNEFAWHGIRTAGSDYPVFEDSYRYQTRRE